MDDCGELGVRFDPWNKMEHRETCQYTRHNLPSLRNASDIETLSLMALCFPDDEFLLSQLSHIYTEILWQYAVLGFKMIYGILPHPPLRMCTGPFELIYPRISFMELKWQSCSPHLTIFNCRSGDKCLDRATLFMFVKTFYFLNFNANKRCSIKSLLLIAVTSTADEDRGMCVGVTAAM